MAVSLDRGDFSMLASLVTLGIKKRYEGEEGTSSYCQQLAAIWNRPLAILVEGASRVTVTCPSSGNMPGKGIPPSWMRMWLPEEGR